MQASLLRRDWLVLRRELLLNRRVLLPSTVIFAAFQIYFVSVVNRTTAWSVFTSIYVAFLAVIPQSRADKSRTNAWSCTLPVTRRDLVRGSYSSAWAVAGAMSIVALAMATLLPSSKVELATALDPDRLLLCTTIITFILALLMPFCLRFGFFGVILIAAILQVLGAATFVAAKAVGGLDSVEGGVAAVFGAIADAIAVLRETVSVPGFQLLVVVVLILVNWISYRFSAALFGRREL